MEAWRRFVVRELTPASEFLPFDLDCLVVTMDYGLPNAENFCLLAFLVPVV